MAEQFLYLTTIGRTTGVERRIEIWFVERQGRYYVVAEGREQAGWVKNLLKEPRVVFSVGTRGDPAAVAAATRAAARVIRDEHERSLAKAIATAMDAKYGWSDGLIVELCPVAD
jgi:deazaflavin-dependent oxidoreductase (nitroreductase family)